MMRSRLLCTLMLGALLTACSQTTTEQTSAATKASTPVFTNHAEPDSQDGQTPAPVLTGAQQQQFLQAKALLRSGEANAAIDIFASLAQQLPAAAGVWYNLALSQWQSGQIDSANRTLLHLAAQSPAYSAGHNLAGVLARQQGQFLAAEQHFKLALNSDPNYAQAHKNLAFLYELYLAKPLQAHFHYKRYFALTGDEKATAWLALLEQQLPQEQTDD